MHQVLPDSMGSSNITNLEYRTSTQDEPGPGHAMQCSGSVMSKAMNDRHACCPYYIHVRIDQESGRDGLADRHLPHAVLLRLCSGSRVIRSKCCYRM